MSAFLMALGIVAMAIGMAAVGFGVPNHEFGLGNTLIVAGTVSAVGGMVLIGLSAAVRQLRRIADGLAARSAARRQPAAEGAEAPAQRASGPRISYPAKPGADGREPRAPEAPRSLEAEEVQPERPRPNIFGVARGAGEPAVEEEPEAVALARAPLAAQGAPAAEPLPEPKVAASDVLARLSSLTAPPRPAAKPEMPPAAAAPERRANMFDAVWPAEVRAARARAETVARAPKLDTLPEAKPEGMLEAKPEPRIEPPSRAEPRVEARPEPKPEPRPEPRVQPRFEPKPAPRLRPEPRFAATAPRERVEQPPVGGEPRQAPPMLPAVQEQRPVAILKSGIIDGMAYTLYTDGSIEAELPQGTMRFASIDELRAHLEKAEGSE